MCVQGGGGGENRPGAYQPVHPVLQGADRALRAHQRGAAVQLSGQPGSADSLHHVVIVIGRVRISVLFLIYYV